MKVTGVPSRSTFTVDVDGTEAGEVQSNGKGQVLVRKLPPGLASIDQVTLIDENGESVAIADF